MFVTLLVFKLEIFVIVVRLVNPLNHPLAVGASIASSKTAVLIEVLYVELTLGKDEVDDLPFLPVGILLQLAGSVPL